MSSIPSGRVEPEVRAGSTATLGKAVKVVGRIHSNEDLYVDGDIEGTIVCRRGLLVAAAGLGVGRGSEPR